MYNYYVSLVDSVCGVNVNFMNNDIAFSQADIHPSRRIISLDTATFIASNFGLLLEAMVYNKNAFIKDCLEAMNRQLEHIHENLKVRNKPDHFMEFGMTVFSSDAQLLFLNLAFDNIKFLSADGSLGKMDEILENMEDNDKFNLQTVLSCPWLFILTFNNDKVFASYVISVIKDRAALHG